MLLFALFSVDNGRSIVKTFFFVLCLGDFSVAYVRLSPSQKKKINTNNMTSENY